MIEYGNIGGMKAYVCETIVIGSGAAGYNAACLLRKGFVDDLVLITPEKKAGTSRNAGCDRMSYWRLSQSGSTPDSVREMADTLTRNGSVDGDNALAEASLSTSSFMRLSDLGVPFPTSRYGEFLSYQAEFDDKARSTTIGARTSKFMTDYLEYEAGREGVEILEGYELLRIIQHHGVLKAIIVMKEDDADTRIILTRNLVLASGAPGSVYEKSAYPAGQTGATGVALDAGISGRNMTIWNHGLVSDRARMKISGDYLRALPSIYSVDENDDRHEIAEIDHELLFRKADEWTFDVRKLEGSSKLDILVLEENEKGRKVYLDYRTSDSLSEEESAWFRERRALYARPVDRLKQLDSNLYTELKDRGVDLERQPLEIAVGAIHMNGGLAVDSWWQTDVEGVFAVGECAGTHGAYIPEGASLNAGQVGARRASSWILEHGIGEWYVDANDLESDVELVMNIISDAENGDTDVSAVAEDLRRRMTLTASAVRERKSVEETLKKVDEYMSAFPSFKVDRPSRIHELFELHDTLVTDKVILSAILDYIETSNFSKGSVLYKDGASSEDAGKKASLIQEASYKDGSVVLRWREPRPVPSEEESFEKGWNGYRRNKNVF